MTDSPVIGGRVENGKRMRATFTFYQGTVGVRARDGALELSFFATSTPSLRPGLQGVVDDQLVTVQSVTDRHLDAAGAAMRQGEVRVVTLTVTPATAS